MRVIAAMSGGVDSAVAAARMIDAGHEVTGVHLALAENAETLRTSARGCCTIEDAADARRVADRLGIPFYVWDMAAKFREEVIADFLTEYAAGNTPNPCLRCNERIKFSALLEKALALGFDAVATGHYARIQERLENGKIIRTLHRAVDAAKDQSYVLGVLDEHALAHAFFPLGDTTKPDIRREAAARGFSIAKKPDSHDICFIPDGQTRTFLSKHIPMRPGSIRDTTGAEVGQHDGAIGFTVGQRRGLALRVPRADHAKRYVVDILPEENTVVVGTADNLQTQVLHAENLRFPGPKLTTAAHLLVQIRAHGQAYPAYVVPHGEQVHITLDHPVQGVARGQSAVIYDGDRVVGSATICGTENTSPAAEELSGSFSRTTDSTPENSGLVVESSPEAAQTARLSPVSVTQTPHRKDSPDS